MLNKLNELSFVIGVFFTIVSLILFGNMLITGIIENINLYSATIFMIFGVAMMFARGKKTSSK
jgi:hypothetical protein